MSLIEKKNFRMIGVNIQFNYNGASTSTYKGFNGC